MKKILSICFWVFMFQLAHAQTEADFDKLLEDYYVEGPGYAVLITKGGNTIYNKAIGMADIENNIKLTPEHVFRIGSITKQITAVCILKLMEEGKLNLDDPITKFIPDYPIQGTHISVKNLLNHTSGIKSYTGLEIWDSEMRKKDFSPKELIDLFKKEPMDFKPGEALKYNNSGYILLGYIIEQITGVTYEDYVEKEIFEALGMDKSRYGHPKEIVMHRASGYTANGAGEVVNAPYLSMTQPYAAGSILSTTADMSKWYHAVFMDKIISKESREMAHSPTILNNGKEERYGFGWSLRNLKGSPVITHNGGINGFTSDSAFLPNESVFITVLSNSNSNNPGKLMQRMAAIAVGKPLENPKSVSVSQKTLDSYVGDYQLGPDFVITVSTKSGKLFAKASGQGILKLLAVEENVFLVDQVEAKVVFNKDANGTVDSLTLHQGGVHQAKKVK